MPKITVDDQTIEVPEGQTILQALDAVGLLMNGVEIPHYCWHPKLSIDGSCRLCQVEVEGMPKLQIACNTLVADGMVIRTRTERVQRAREGVMELLLVNHPLDCPICDQAGECKLQDYAYEYGVPASRTREPRRAAKKRVELGPTIVFDQERCILCRRCVRFCREVPGTGELGVVNRGDRSLIETFPGTQLENDYSMNVADICPVGALTTRDFRFRIRVWFLEDVPGLCTGCSNGCNVHLGVASNRVYRYVPRRNDAVNQTWICDEGRLSYKQIEAGRLRHASLRDGSAPREVPYGEAVAAAAERLLRVLEARGPGAIGVLASPHATNEDLAVLRRLADALGVETRGMAVVRGREDRLLMKAEKAANAEGARRLGFGEAGPVLDRVRQGALRALIVLGHDLLASGAIAAPEELAGLETLVLLDSHQSELQRVAHVVIPVRVAAEKRGTLTNAAGLVQEVVPAVEPAFEAWSEGEVLWRVGADLALPGFAGPFDAVAATEAAP
jgi:NADH-quinone oxidoreductase subunit G